MSDEIQDRPNSHRERLPSWRHVIWRQLTWRKVLAATLVIVLLCLLATPTIVNRSWCRLWILDKISGNIKGHFSATDWRFGWWVAPRCQQFRIHPPQGASLLELPSLSGNRTLLQWLFTRDLGDFQIERPLLRYEETPDGSNFARTFNEPPPRLREYLKKLAHTYSGSVTVVDGRFQYLGGPGRPMWELSPLNYGLHLTPPTEKDPSPRVTIDASRLVDHFKLDQPICNDLIKFVAPVLADATWVEGEASFSLSEAHFPLDDPKAGRIQGAMTIHSVRAGPGPIITTLAQRLKLPEALDLVEESVIEFETVEQAVHHQGLRFRLGQIHIETSGWIGYDESLRMVARVTMPTFDEDTGPLRRMVSGRTWEFPIEGTLSDPKIKLPDNASDGLTDLVEQLPEMADKSREAVEMLMQGLRDRRDAVLERRRERVEQEEGAEEGGPLFPTRPGGLIQRWRENRARRNAANENE